MCNEKQTMRDDRDESRAWTNPLSTTRDTQSSRGADASFTKGSAAEPVSWGEQTAVKSTHSDGLTELA